MSTVTIRIPAEAHARAQRLARRQSRPLAQIIGSALEHYEDEALLHEYNTAMARVRADSAESAAFDAEVAAWDSTLGDGLPTEPTGEEEGSWW